jgi:hypothetical protein
MVAIGLSSRMESTRLKGAIVNAIKRAGFVLAGCGGLVIVSAFLPWVSAFGITSGHLTGFGVLLFSAIGGALILLASTALAGRRPPKVVQVFLWIIAAVDALLVFAFFEVVSSVGGLSGGAVSPAIGFWVAMLGLAGSAVGTIMLQVARARVARDPAAMPIVAPWPTAPYGPTVPAVPAVPPVHFQ